VSDESIKKLSKFMTERCNITLDEVKICSKGWNWGKVVVLDNSLSFACNVDEKTEESAFDLPMSMISQSTLQVL